MKQSAASFLPCMALDPGQNERVLDMCCAPGGKTTYLAAMMRNTGALVNIFCLLCFLIFNFQIHFCLIYNQFQQYANDVNAARLIAVRANLARMGVKNAVITHYDGRRFPPMSFDRILVDAPCTGLGVVSRDPSVKFSKTAKDVAKCAHLQRELLLTAIDRCDASSKTGGVIVYSTW